MKVKLQPSTFSGWAVIGSSVMLTIGGKKVSELWPVLLNLTIEQLISLIIVLIVGVYNIVRDETTDSSRFDDSESAK